MSKLSLHLPEPLDTFVDEQATLHGHADAGGYVRSLIEKERDRQILRQDVLEGLATPVTRTADEVYFAELRERVHRHGSR